MTKPTPAPAVCVAPPVGLDGLKAFYGDFAWENLGKGAVRITDDFAARNIVTLRDVASTGLSIQLHRLVSENFVDGLKAAIKASGYVVKQLGGFVPRHKMWNDARGLSVHSWGAAFDVNWSTNPAGQEGPCDIPPEFTEEFAARGWVWGGNWKGSARDVMHYQLARDV